MKTHKLISFIICFVFLGTTVFAVVPDEKIPEERELRENINTLRLLKMTQALDLTEEQAAKIFPGLNRIEKEKAEIHREIGIKLKELKLNLDKLDKGDVEEQEIEALIQDLKELRSLLMSKDEEIENFIAENLTVVQRAKYILFSVEFNRVLREKMERARILRDRIMRRDKRKF